MKIISAIIFCLATFQAMAQTPGTDWCTINEYSAILYYKNDVVKVSCDTVYLINPATYKLYDQIFRNHKAMNSDVKKLTTLYDYTKTLYENRIAQQNEEYNSLKREFDLLTGRTQTLVQSTTGQLAGLTGSLQKIDESIAKANSGIEQAKGMIRTEMKNAFKQRMKWGVGGFVVGVGAAALIVAATN